MIDLDDASHGCPRQRGKKGKMATFEAHSHSHPASLFHLSKTINIHKVSATHPLSLLNFPFKLSPSLLTAIHPLERLITNVLSNSFTGLTDLLNPSTRLHTMTELNHFIAPDILTLHYSPPQVI